MTVESRIPTRCPFTDQQFGNIRAYYPALASTGCTKEFCQASRSIKTDEVRVGENRSLASVELEAQDFLHELYREGQYDSESAYHKRREQVLDEIRAGVVEGVVRFDRSKGLIGGNWAQTQQELRFGVRRAWRNSRRCIMRSHCEELELYDFRAIRSSEKMATHLLKAVSEAFNQGNIRPSVFVFPPRDTNCRGPLIWNTQILQFAGYEADDDGLIVGDPMSVELTKSIISLGWKPPEPRGRFDILPLVTMADHDRPFIAEIPAQISKLVHVRHPKYVAFERLDLKWTLTSYRFMDAEVGVRDLADTFRYNALPRIVREMGIAKGRLNDDVEEFEDLPEFDKLWMLSRAQAELNYAVHWSFLQAKVTMTDSLTASMKWAQYDDDFQRERGFRLPSDPYWLAPPQGSIIPLWHRGGSPNYQPKPMICRHVQDPIKAWGREKNSDAFALGRPKYTCPLQSPVDVSTEVAVREFLVPDVKIRTQPYVETVRSVVHDLSCPKAGEATSIEIYFCSAGTIAERLAGKLHLWVQRLVQSSSMISLKPQIEPLNNLRESSLTANQIILLLVSSTGQGEVPPNGCAFLELCDGLIPKTPSIPRKNFRFSIFGNGDSRYSNTFNGAAIKLLGCLRELEGIPLANGLFNGDTALNPFPLKALKAWLTKLEPCLIQGGAVQWIQKPGATTIAKNNLTSPVTVSVVPVEDDLQQYDEHQQQLLSTLKDGLVISTSSQIHGNDYRTLLLDLCVNTESFEEMSCIQVLPTNSPSKIQRALLALSVDDIATIDVHLEGENPSYSRFLREFVDLELPFLKLKWLNSIPSAASKGLTKGILKRLSVLEVLERLNGLISHLRAEEATNLRQKICIDVPLLHTRTYSLASSETYYSKLKKPGTAADASYNVSIMTKVIPKGRFSSTFLNDSPLPIPLKYRIVDSLCGFQLRKHYLSPFIIVATGAGFGPVRALLQWRIATAVAAGRTLPPLKRGVSLFLGLKECDVELCLNVLNEALALDLIGVLDIVVSNAEKRRVYDELPRYSGLVKEKVVKGRGVVFVCASQGAEEGTKFVLKGLIGGRVENVLGDRYLKEVF